MSTVEKLLNLQKHYNRLSEIEDNINNPTTLDEIKMLLKDLKDMELKLKYLDNNIKGKQKQNIKNNLHLKELEYNKSEIEKSLYGGNISDLKQLTALDKEREALNYDIEEMENKILSDMETIEILKKEYFNLKEKFEKNKSKYSRLVKEHKALMSKYNEEANIERKEIEKIIHDIDKDVFNKFKKLIDTKGTAIVEAVNNRCTGCNMVLPLITIERLKKEDNLVFCENCHRILYLS